MPAPISSSVDPRYTAHIQYQQFVNFAQGASEDAIAESGEGIIVKAKAKSDFVGNVFRTSSSKDVNDYVRSRFKSAIMGMFGVSDDSALPDSVREAMKLDDFNARGKPLTARRIRAVQTAVDQFFADKAQSLMAEAVKQGVEDNEMSQRLVRAVVRACVDDPEAMEVAKARIKDILVDFTTTTGDVLRPVHGVKEKVDAITGNFRALRAFAQGDEAVLAAGKGFVHLKSEDFNALMTAVTAGRQQLQPHLDQLLKHPNGAKDLDEGVRAFGTALDETMATCTAVFRQPVGAADAARLKGFVLGALLHRDGDAKSIYHELQVMLHSDAAKQLKALYRDLETDLRSESAQPGPGPFNDLPDGLRRCMADHAARGSASLDQLNDAMYDFYSIPADERRPVRALQGNTRASNDFGVLGQKLQVAGRETMRADRDAFLRVAVKGSGTAADQMRAVFKQKIDEGAIYRPAETLKSQSEETIRRLSNQAFTSLFRKFKTPTLGMAEFGSAVSMFDVTLPNGDKLSNSVFVACDQLAKFVTGGEKTSFNALTASEKNKVYIVMSFISREAAFTPFDGPARTLNPGYDPQKGPLEEAKHKRMFRVFDDPNYHGKPVMSLELGKDGGLKIGVKDSRYVSQVGTLKKNGLYDDVKVAEKISEYSLMSALMTGRPLGSTVEVEYELELTGDAIDRLAGSGPQAAQVGKTDLTCSGFKMDMRLHDPQ